MSTGRIPAHIIDQVRAAADVVEVVGRRVQLTQKGRDFWGRCPFHGDKDPSFKVDRGRGTWYCFGCGEGGSVFTFLMKDEGLSFPEAVRELAVRYGVELPKPRLSPQEQEEERRRERLLRVLALAGKFFIQELKGPAGEAAREYVFQRRGLDAATVEAFGLGFAPDAWEALGRHLETQGVTPELAVEAGLSIARERGQGAYDRFRGRVVFPIRDASGRVVSFGGRILGDGEPKYLNGPESPLFSKSRTLYNLHEARPHMRRKNRALVVEGYFDVITCAAHGFGEATAPMGTALTPEQVRRLKGQAGEAVLVFDGDQAGRRAARRALPIFLAAGMPARVLALPQGEDPDTFLRAQGAEALEAAIAAARPLVESVLESILSENDLGTPEGQSQAVGAAGEIIAAIKDPVARWGYLRLLAVRLKLPERVVAARLGLPADGPETPSRPAPSSGSAAPRAGRRRCFQNQRCLLETALASPEAARVLYQAGLLEGLEDAELASVAAAMVELLAAGGEPTPAAVADQLEEAGLARLASQLANSRSAPPAAIAAEAAQGMVDLHHKRSESAKVINGKKINIKAAAGPGAGG